MPEAKELTPTSIQSGYDPVPNAIPNTVPSATPNPIYTTTPNPVPNTASGPIPNTIPMLDKIIVILT